MKQKVLDDNLILKVLSKNQKCLDAISKDLNVSTTELKEYLTNQNNGSITFYIDGGSRNNPGESGIGVVEIHRNKRIGYYEYTGILTNNEAEYKALIRALEIGLEKGIKDIEIFSDSELVCNQINGTYKIKSQSLAVFYKKAMGLISEFKSFKINHVLRNKNKEADKMVNMAIDLKKNGKIELAVAGL